MDINIKLTYSEMLVGAQAGILRQIENQKKNRSPAYGAGSENDWQLHIEGGLGEMALAKYLGIYWSGKGKLRAPDVGDLEVRTRSRPDYDLIAHPRDPDDRQIWLLTGKNGQYVVRGWLLGRDAKQDCFWSDPSRKGRPAYFVPQQSLHAPVLRVAVA